MHNTPFLWRWFHQMHHSAERVDIWGALYFHPFDTLGWTLVGSLALVLGFGVSAEAAIVINVVATFYGMFQHANIRTPHWLGYIIQRPESHSGHHERGVHARNYRDLPLLGHASSARSTTRRNSPARSASTKAARSASATCSPAADRLTWNQNKAARTRGIARAFW